MLLTHTILQRDRDAYSTQDANISVVLRALNFLKFPYQFFPKVLVFYLPVSYRAMVEIFRDALQVFPSSFTSFKINRITSKRTTKI